MNEQNKITILTETKEIWVVRRSGELRPVRCSTCGGHLDSAVDLGPVSEIIKTNTHEEVCKNENSRNNDSDDSSV